MKYRQDVVISQLDGSEEPIDVMMCPNCGNESFTLYVLHRGRHQHIQCLKCEETFCDGQCAVNNVQ